MAHHEDFLFHFHRSTGDIRACIAVAVLDLHRREDIFQEVSRVLWRKFDEYDPGRSFGAWARGITVNKILESRRQDARFPLALAPEALTTLLESFSDTPPPAAEDREALDHCLHTLPDKSRRLLDARYREGRSCTDLARQENVNLKAMHQTLSRLRRALAECVRQRLATPATDSAP